MSLFLCLNVQQFALFVIVFSCWPFSVRGVVVLAQGHLNVVSGQKLKNCSLSTPRTEPFSKNTCRITILCMYLRHLYVLHFTTHFKTLFAIYMLFFVE